MIWTAPAACSVYTAKTPALSSPGGERWSAFSRRTLRARNTPLSTHAIITEGKRHELRVARRMQFTPGTMLVFDRDMQIICGFAG